MAELIAILTFLIIIDVIVDAVKNNFTLSNRLRRRQSRRFLARCERAGPDFYLPLSDLNALTDYVRNMRE